jgi:hypothetical protein
MLPRLRVVRRRTYVPPDGPIARPTRLWEKRIRTKRSAGLGLSRFIVAVLAIALAVFPIAGARGVAHVGHQPELGATAHHSQPADAASHDASVEMAFDAHDCSSNEHGKQHPATGCCDMGACHALAFVASIIVAGPAPFGSSVVVWGDEQVRGEFSFRLDRPPRTV